MVEQYQYSPTLEEVELPALSDRWFLLNLGQPFYLTQKHSDRLHESMIQYGDSMFVPAGQPSYWLYHSSDTHRPMLNIYLPPKLVEICHWLN